MYIIIIGYSNFKYEKSQKKSENNITTILKKCH